MEPLQISSVSEATKESKPPKAKGKAKEKQPDSAPVDPASAPAVGETAAQSSQTLEGECFFESVWEERSVEVI